MTSTGSSASRVKRKPPPAFPYSSKYPHPDPTDPLASLQALRERAKSSQGYHSSHNPSNTSLSPTPPRTVESDRSSTQFHAELPPLPRAVIHAKRSTEALQPFRDGYHSDFVLPPRPPRAVTRPVRDSKLYSTDPDIASSIRHLRHQELSHHPAENSTESRYRKRRRSKTISSIPPVQSQVVLVAEPEILERPATEKSSTTTEARHHTNHTTQLSQNQYVYDDRQSHGHVYPQMDAPHRPSTIDSHGQSTFETSIHSGHTTPPMTPDDTLTSSSVSVRDRSESLSPHAYFPELPLTMKGTMEDSGLLPLSLQRATVENEHVTVESGGLIDRAASQIQTSEFPMLLGKATESDSPPALPVPPPQPHPARSESQPEPGSSHGSQRLSGIVQRDPRDSDSKRPRRSSVLVRVRKTSDPLPPTRRKQVPLRESEYGASIQAARAEVSSMTMTGRSHPEVVRATGVSGDASDSKKRAKMAHRKSLSHVSLGVTPLPNVSFGPSASPASLGDNLSTASTLVADPGDEDVPSPTSSAPPEPPSHHTQRPQTLAQALEFTPLPSKDTPLPPIRKDSHLPTPPREPSRTSRVPALASTSVLGPGYERRMETQQSLRNGVAPIQDVTLQVTAIARPRKAISGHAPAEMEMDEVILMQHTRLEPSVHHTEEALPSPPLLANSLLTRPTSTASTAVSHVPPPPTLVPLVSPSPTSAQSIVPSISVSLLPLRADNAPQRAPSPPSPSRHPSSLPSRRYPESPLPVPPDEFEPPPPQPLPLSPPHGMDIDLPTPLPQPPLPQPPPIPPLPSALPVVRAPPLVDRRDDSSPPPTPTPARPRSPHDYSRQVSEELRTLDDHHERVVPTSFLPIAHVRTVSPPPPEPQYAPPLPATSTGTTRSRLKVVQTETKTPYNSLRQRRPGQGQGQSQGQDQTRTQLPFRPQPAPPASTSASERVQSLQSSNFARAQPGPQPPSHTNTRAQSPQSIVTSRAQSPLPRRPQSPQGDATAAHQSFSRAATLSPPPPASYSSHGHGLLQARAFASPPSSAENGYQRGRERSGEQERALTSGAMSVESTATSPPYPTSVESTPNPLPIPTSTFNHRGSGTAMHRARTSNEMSEPDLGRTRTELRRPHRSRTEEPSAVTFDEHAGLSKDQIQKASVLTVIAQNGLRLPFGDLIRQRKTIVIFIRHFWCAACQDYMYSISRNVNYESLKRAGVDMVIIGNGSSGMIKSYRNIFRTPIPLYTDPTLRLYAALGMTLKTSNPGPDSEKGEYVRHGVIGGLAMVVRNALRVGMPVWERGGDSTQLGGEFVLGPDFKCAYAHRMTTTRSHAPIREVLRAAGHNPAATAVQGAGLAGHAVTLDEDAWMRDRHRSLTRIHTRREKRRELGVSVEADIYGPELGYGSDSGSESGSRNGDWPSAEEKQQLQMQVAQREREQQQLARANQRRQRRSLQVANPDVRLDQQGHRTYNSGSRTHGTRNEGRRNDNRTGGITPEYLNRHGRREDEYDTEDTTAYIR